MSTALRKFKTPKDMAYSLQKEVDLILSQVNEGDIYAEFREHEIIEIEDGVQHRIVETALDERINMKLGQHNPTYKVKITERPPSRVTKIQRLVYLFFKPFHI
ncbi:hypothetical protein KW782_03155 [Candidatus Parcubacteria bacterium]|nr:hypothetical protein [Candidatus Parcubacteria bacterium]